MINEAMFEYGAAPSAIRELFGYGVARKAIIGDDKVFDFSIGNPSVPAPQAVADAIVELSKVPPQQMHAYTAAQGTVECRTAVADNLNRRFGTSYGPNDLYMTLGAAGSLSISIKAVVNPGDDVIVISPFFPEYRVWIQTTGARCVQVPARESDFQVDLQALDAAINERTSAVIINSPNNPVGVVYTRETLEGMAQVLRRRSQEFGHPIFIISDEPYREIAYEGFEVSWVPNIYENTLVCYSWSKSLSLPGERIGYILVPPAVSDAHRVYAAVCGAGRALGFVCSTALFQGVIERCVNCPTNVDAYRHNRELLCDIMDRCGYEYIVPQGAFYLWIKALEPNAQAFSDKAKAHELLLVPSDSFGVAGWVRAGYCVAPEVIEGSADAFAALKRDYE